MNFQTFEVLDVSTAMLSVEMAKLVSKKPSLVVTGWIKVMVFWTEICSDYYSVLAVPNEFFFFRGAKQ